jgi:hypothetical protein
MNQFRSAAFPGPKKKNIGPISRRVIQIIVQILIFWGQRAKNIRNANYIFWNIFLLLDVIASSRELRKSNV